MKSRLFSAVSATALSLSLLAAPVFAQDLGLQQLQDAATSTLSQLNLDTSMVESLTLEELTLIEAANSTGGNDAAKVDQIETVLRNAEDRIAAGGGVVPSGPAGDVTAEDLDSLMVVKSNVQAQLAQLGVAADVETLSDEQLLEIQAISGGTQDDTTKKEMVETVIAN